MPVAVYSKCVSVPSLMVLYTLVKQRHPTVLFHAQPQQCTALNGGTLELEMYTALLATESVKVNGQARYY